MKSKPAIDLTDRKFELIELIAALQPVKKEQLDLIENEIETTVKTWHQPYAEYASEGLGIAVLLSPDGGEENFSYDDCDSPQETELLRKMPVLKETILSLGLNIMASRLLRLSPGTFLHEHRDYVYLKEVERYRLHIPVVTNSDAHIITPGKKIHMERGFLWKLDPKNTIHSACNFGNKPRIHVMLDCYMNDKLAQLLESATLSDKLVTDLPRLEAGLFESWVSESRKILHEGNQTEAEEFLLRKFCQFNLKDKTTFDLIFALYEEEPDQKERLSYWKERIREVYPA